MNSSRQTPSPLLALFVASAVSLVPVPAMAFALDAPQASEEDETRARAMQAYRRGTELYNAAEFEEALASFEEAATLYASPDFQFNIGKCYERLGKYEQAIHHYETYLRTSEDPPDQAVIQNTVIDLKERLAAEQQAEQDAIEAGIAPPPAEPVELPPSGRPLVITGGALLGVGLAVGLGGGLAFGLQVSSDNAALGTVLDGNPDGLTFAEAEDIAARARGNQTLELVMVGIGGAVLVTGVALLAVGIKRNKARAAASESAASLRAAPSWTRGGAGFTLQGKF